MKVKAFRYRFIYDSLSLLQLEYTDGSSTPLFGQGQTGRTTQDGDGSYLHAARLDVNKTITTVSVHYWKEMQPLGDQEVSWRITDRIAAIEFYDADGEVIAEMKSERSSEEEKKEEIQRIIPKGHEIMGLRCCPSSDGIKNLSFLLWSLPKESTS